MSELRFQQVACIAFVLALAFGTTRPSLAQGPADGLFTGVKALYATAQTKPEAQRLDDYQGIRRLLDMIVEDYPSSDLAVGIVLHETIDGVDIAAIYSALDAAEPDDTTLATASVELEADADMRPDATADDAETPDAIPFSEVAAAVSGTQRPDTPNLAALSVANASSETALDLNNQSIRDLQARLSVLGYDPNGIDGVIGDATRAALREWQGSQGLAQTGFLNSGQLELLVDESQSALDVWLQDERNAALYTAPPTPTSTRRALRNGWFIGRNGMYCKRFLFGVQYCTRQRPPSA